jgi:hypothetical protein
METEVCVRIYKAKDEAVLKSLTNVRSICCEIEPRSSVCDQVRDMGIEEVLSAPRPPWQWAYVERIIGWISARMPRPCDCAR